MEIEELFIQMEGELKNEIQCLTVSPQKADDIYQNAYLRIHRYKEEGKEFYGNLRSWKAMLKLMVRNMTIDEKRKESRRMERTTDEVFMMIDDKTPETDMIDYEQEPDQAKVNKKLRKAFKKMNHSTYMTYQLRMKGYKFKDIAYLTDCGINTALGRMRYAIMKIADELKGDGEV